MRQIEVGQEPTRIAHVGSRVYVSLRAERRVAVLNESGESLEPVGYIDTGAEPYGVVANDKRVYVASSVEGVVGEYDASTLARLRSWQIGGEPRWLALHPSDRALYVGSAYGGGVTHIDLDQGVASPMDVPSVTGFNFRDGSPIDLVKRVLDVAVAPDGKTVYAAMLYVDNQTTIPDVTPGEADGDSAEPRPCNGPMDDRAPPPPSDKPEDPSGGSSGSGNGASAPPVGDPAPGGCGPGGGYDQQKFNPAVDAIPVDETTGAPDTSRTSEAINIVSFATFEDANGNVNGEQINGYPAALAVSGDSKYVFAAIEGAEAIIAVRMDLGGNGATTNAGAARDAPPDATSPGPGGFGVPGGSFSFRNTTVVKTSAGPRGLAVIDGRLYAHAFLDRKVEEIAVSKIGDVFDFQSGETMGKPVGVDIGQSGLPRQLRASNGLTVATQTLSDEAESGRRLFFASNNPQMSTVGAGVSCATCHFEQRTDGVTWRFERGLRQTPNLAVNLKETLPVGWAGNVPTVADEGFSTSQKLMGGQGLPVERAHDIEQYLYSVRLIDTPNRNALDEHIINGQAVFARVGCVSCHNGASFTDNKVYTMLGLERVKTRPLAGIAATAPFFHDGTAATLEDVIDRASRGEMGERFTISVEEKADLVSYLRSL